MRFRIDLKGFQPLLIEMQSHLQRSQLSKILVTALTCQALAPVPGRAQISTEETAAGGLLREEVVITATRTATDLWSVPALVATLGREDMEKDLVRTVPEALRQVPGVAIQKTANGQGSPIIRGFTGYRTLAMVDGVRYNHSAYRDGPNEYFTLIDPQALQNLELVQGPGSVLYGSDAVGGALNLFTRESGYHEEAAGVFFQHGSLFGRWHSAEQSWLGRVDYNFGQGDFWGLHIGGTWKDFGDVIAAEVGEQRRTGYTQGSYDIRLDARLADHWTFTAVHQGLRQDDSWRTHATIFGVSFAGSETGSDLRRVTDYQRSLSYARLRGEDLSGPVSSAQVTLSWQTLDEDLDRVRGNGVRELSTMDIATMGVDAQFTSPLLGGTLTWGADYYRDEVDTARRDFNADGQLSAVRVQGPVGDDASYDLFGVYLQQEQPLGKHTTLLAGGRFTHAQAEVGRYENPFTGGAASLEDSWNNTVGSLRLMQDLEESGGWKGWLGISQAFRAPNLGDLSRLGASRSDEIESAATGLDPEKFTNYEIGLKHRGGPVQFSAAAFHTVLDEYITSTPTGRVIDGQRQVTKQNSAEGYVQGLQGEIEWRLADEWTLFGGLAWSEGEADAFVANESRREPLSRIPPLTGTYGLRWTRPDGKIWAEVSGTTAARADRLNTADQSDRQRIPPDGTPGYTLLHLRGGWQVNDHLAVYAGLENLLNEAYRVHGSGSNEPGFGGTLGLKISF